MRLIDANKLYDAISDNWSAVSVCSLSDILGFISETETIYPETLPVVRELREKLELVTAERDAAVSDIETYMAYPNDNCQFCKNANCQSRNGTKPCLPKWRGLHKEE